MNTGQMALTIGAFMLLGTVMLNFRVLNFQNEDVLNTNEYTQKAVTIGRALFEEMAQRPFDNEIFKGTWIRQASQLSSCGPGSLAYPSFDDFDDFSGSVFLSPQPGTTPTTATPKCLWDTWGYRVAVTVQYVSESNPNLPVNYYTFSKRATLVITNQFSPDTVRMSYLATY